MNVQIMNEKDLKSILQMKDVIKIIEEVYKQKSENQSVVWETIFYDFVPGKADMDIKSGFLKKQKIFGHKTVTWFGDNAAKGLPTLNGLICVFDGETGMPIGITEGAYITGIRTGAAAAIGAKYLANPESKNVLIVGAGNQLKFQIAAILTVFPDLAKVQVYDREIEKAKEGIQGINVDLEAMGVFNSEEKVVAVENLQESVKSSDIIITVTPSKTPFIKKEWLAPGTHLSTIGADMVGKQEIEASIFADARIFTDDLSHSSQVGEMETALKQGIIKVEDVSGEIGDLILKKLSGRQASEDITIFDATGMALMDVATAKVALDTALNSEADITSVVF